MKVAFRIIVWFIMLAGGVMGGLLLDKMLFPNVYSNLWIHLFSFILGLLLLKMVMAISRNTGRTLASYGRAGELPRMETNRFVQQGVYKVMRHPMHLGLMLFPFTIAFLAGSPSFILIIAPAETIFMLLMIKLVEEPEAISKFGDQYRDYMKHTPWFCFRAACLKLLFRKVKKNH
jgi:protein-S-isoprenylcysteine O-methyltransferase Ste14